jgi:trimeric autotransporter adhesin
MFHTLYSSSARCAAMVAAVCLGLVACGGGGGGGSGPPVSPPVTPPAAPVLSLTPRAIKTFGFSWAAVSGATEYRLLENPDGGSGFTRIATATGTATTLDQPVFLPARINARYILQACNSGGCTDSSTVNVSGTLAQAVGYLKASNTGAGDLFGWSVALSGDGTTLAVGAPLESSSATGINGNQHDDSAEFAGAVYVFARSGANWAQQAYIKASNAELEDFFGVSVALSNDGNTLAVGANSEDSAAMGIGGDQGSNAASDSGAVYVFTRSGTSWSQQAYVKASNPDPADQFGLAVALSGDGTTLAVGANGEGSSATGINGSQADNGAEFSGAVYVFARSGTTWAQQAYVKASNTGARDAFGGRVALADDGNTLAVAARSEDSGATGIDGNQGDDSASNAGAAYVFVRSGTTWSQQAYVKASNTEAQDIFGESVALSGDGNTLAVGALFEDSSATGVDGNQGDNTATSSGALYVFSRSGTTWSQQAYLKASNTGGGDQFGWNAALSGDGNVLAVTAQREASGATGIGGDQMDNSAALSGAVYVFRRNAGAWSQQAYVKARNTGAGDRFGYSLALSDDATLLAVGADQEDSSATGIGGDSADNSVTDSGAVYLY